MLVLSSNSLMRHSCVHRRIRAVGSWAAPAPAHQDRTGQDISAAPNVPHEAHGVCGTTALRLLCPREKVASGGTKPTVCDHGRTWLFISQSPSLTGSEEVVCLCGLQYLLI